MAAPVSFQPSPVQFVCTQNLGVYQSLVPQLQIALEKIDTEKRTWVDRFIIFDRDGDPKFATPGMFKKIFYCVERDLLNSEFTVHLALRSPKDCLSFEKEKKAFTLLNGVKGIVHPLLIETLGRFEYMIVELYNQSDLLSLLLDEERKLNEYQAQMLGYALVSALLECHAHGVIHRDIKLDNILVRELEDKRFEVKIIDFGMAFLPKVDSKTEAIRTCGTPLYISRADWDSKSKTKSFLPADCARDAIAMGYILFALATGNLPCAVKKSDSGHPIGVSFYPKEKMNLGIFAREIDELVYGRRAETSPLDLIQARMRTILLKTYPDCREVQALQLTRFRKITPKWEKEERGLVSFVTAATSIALPKGMDGTICDLIRHYWLQFSAKKEADSETIFLSQLAELIRA